MGCTLLTHPTRKQKKIISSWMGCARFIWNAKCDEDTYLTQFARRYLPMETYPPINQTYAQYKSKELSPWLYECPSQILRNSAHNWYETYRNFLKGQCGKPKKKRKGDEESILLTRELFRFEKGLDGVTRLFIGTKTNNIGFLVIKNHCAYEEPNMLRLRKKNGRYFISFSYEDKINEDNLFSQNDHLNYLKKFQREELEKITVGIDRGVKIPVQAGSDVYDFTIEQKKKKQKCERYIKRCQRRLAGQKKGSKRRKKRKSNISKAYEKIANIRKDFCHKTSRAIVEKEETKIIILEDLCTKQMTQKPKVKKDESTGKYLPNSRKAKARLNQLVLDKGWYQLDVFLQYKSYRKGKALFKISAHHTSQECVACGHTHPNNRKKQELFFCECCGHSDNADRNAAGVIKKRAIDMIVNSGTELSNRGVLLDSGRGAAYKTRQAKANCARGEETSKKKELAANAA